MGTCAGAPPSSGAARTAWRPTPRALLPLPRPPAAWDGWHTRWSRDQACGGKVGCGFGDALISWDPRRAAGGGSRPRVLRAAGRVRGAWQACAASYLGPSRGPAPRARPCSHGAVPPIMARAVRSPHAVPLCNSASRVAGARRASPKAAAGQVQRESTGGLEQHGGADVRPASRALPYRIVQGGAPIFGVREGGAPTSPGGQNLPSIANHTCIPAAHAAIQAVPASLHQRRRCSSLWRRRIASRHPLPPPQGAGGGPYTHNSRSGRQAPDRTPTPGVTAARSAMRV